MKFDTQINNLSYLKENRRALRNNPTEAEALLWQFLKGKLLNGNKFRRQHSINHFILDFYCPNQRLAIELDGGIHLEKEVKANDKEKEQMLASLNIRLLRFKNEEVLENVVEVLDKIEKCLK